MKQYLERAEYFGPLPRFDYLLFHLKCSASHVWLLSRLPQEQIELLVQSPFFWNYDHAGFNGFLGSLFPERLQISLGLLILSIGGTAPFWYQEYNFVLRCGFYLAWVLGWVNAAISIISELSWKTPGSRCWVFADQQRLSGHHLTLDCRSTLILRMDSNLLGLM